MTTTRFSLGRLVATPGVLTTISHQEIHRGIRLHSSGVWGEVPPEDRETNEFALVNGLRLLSVYRTPGGVIFWIITEADRSLTTVLLPEEY